MLLRELSPDNDASYKVGDGTALPARPSSALATTARGTFRLTKCF
jgi:hypothetical protein